MEAQPLIVCVTGAGGQIAYSFFPQLLRGQAFPNRKIELRMLDIQPSLNVLKGVALELEDCNFPLLTKVSLGCDPAEMFKDADVIVFLGGFPRLKGQQRKDLLEKNKNIFQIQGQALTHAKKTCRCVVIANPANTNAKILSHFSKGQIPQQNITCLTRLDHNRALGQIAKKTNCTTEEIEGVMIFGNHSPTQYPAIKNIKVKGQPISKIVERYWLQKQFIPRVQKRGGQILNVRGGSSVFSAASAVIDHLKDWYEGSQRVVSMGIRSNGAYDVPEGLWSSFPVKCSGNFKYQIVPDIPLTDYCKELIAQSCKQLKQQCQMAGI